MAIERATGEPLTAQAVLELDDAAVATSGDYRNFFTFDGIRYSHAVDPATGRPVTHDTASVTVLAASAAEASFRTLRRGLGLQRQPKSVAQSLRLRGGASDATRGDVAQEQGSDPEMSDGAVMGVEQLGWERAEAWKRLADGETPDEEFHDSDLLSSDELHKLVREMVRPFLACRVCRACLCVCADFACGLGVCGVTPYTTMRSGRSKCPRGW